MQQTDAKMIFQPRNHARDPSGRHYKLTPMTTSVTREAVMDAAPAQKKAGQTIQINNYS